MKNVEIFISTSFWKSSTPNGPVIEMCIEDTIKALSKTCRLTFVKLAYYESPFS